MKIPYSKQNISEKDIFEVKKVLNSELITQGKIVNKFEKKICDYVGANFGIASNSATSSLHVAAAALGLKKGDIFWTSPISFVATANCGLYCGADVDFVDIDPKTYNICLIELKKKLINAKSIGKLPKIIILVHMAGQSTPNKEIYELVKPLGIKIIEDASHSLGGEYLNNKIGNCKYSDITVFSFHPVKMITTGEGGMAVTNSKELETKMRRLVSHGITREEHLMKNKFQGPWYYEQLDLGWNYRLTEFQAALGLSQMKRIDSFVKKRNKIASNYNFMLKDLPIKKPTILKSNKSTYHLYIIRLIRNSNYKNIFNHLRNKGILVNLHYIPIHFHPFYKNLGFKAGDFPNAEDYSTRSISIPIYPTLTEKQQKYITNSLREIL